ncbi:SspB family protein [Ruegeria sp. HKCCA5463]|uniref:SspB family protein n=1 Tax=Ruegeria sp. HKCCA5463 TaxID=2682994 RepID=UPI001489B580|nr:ClpXP protease specificity-enhancing factor SspB [Ruegeria sp. HKCCA5463]
MSQGIDYGNLMHTAMRGLIKTVLKEVSETGLPGAHHFFITFDTREDGVEIADWLRERYPEEMTIVMQHWFENLEVGDLGFGITLNFGDAPEPLYVPYSAIKTFVDPSVEFGLRFESPEDEIEEDQFIEDDIEVEEEEIHHDADIVSLDSFRK